MYAILYNIREIFLSIKEGKENYENVERTLAGLQPLTYSNALEAGASVRAKEINVLFAHVRPDGREVKSVMNGASYAWFGENLAKSSASNTKNIVAAWMRSPAHRANILNSKFAQVGVACWQGSDGNYYWVELFSSKK